MRVQPAAAALGYAEQDVERLVVEPAKTAGLPESAGAGGRSPFARDRARVLHSGSFRRLAGKTQVVAPDEDAVPRTRLTHSLEVAQIAREIGEQLGCDADLVDLAGLAHDIGHPPFGHNGEAALDAVGAAAGGFEANAQNLRLLSRLEPKIITADGRPAGLNLTRASLDAVIKYPWPRPDDRRQVRRLPRRCGRLRVDQRPADGPRRTGACLEAQVMDWADDVAYSVHDVEDGVSAGRIDLGRLADPAERETIAVAAQAFSDESAEPTSAPCWTICWRCRWWRRGSVTGPDRSRDAAVEADDQRADRAVGHRRRSPPPGPRPGRVRCVRYTADLQVPRVLRAEVAVLKAIARQVRDGRSAADRDPARASSGC